MEKKKEKTTPTKTAKRSLNAEKRNTKFVNLQ